MADFVMVGCKILHGIYIEVGDKTILLNGIMSSKQYDPISLTPFDGAVGLTRVPRDFWEAWKKNNQNYAPFQRGLIFGANDKQSVWAEAKEKKQVKHGLERISKDDLPANIQVIQAGQTV